MIPEVEKNTKKRKREKKDPYQEEHEQRRTRVPHDRGLPGFRASKSVFALDIVDDRRVGNPEGSQYGDGPQGDGQQPVVEVDIPHEARSGQRPCDVLF